jgi:Co/Zn/Cd efflux system component
MVKILHSGDGHHGCSHSHSEGDISQVTYEMEDMEMDGIDIGGAGDDNNEELGLRHNDSLNEPGVVGKFSKSFDIGAIKLDPKDAYYSNDLNRSSVNNLKPDTGVVHGVFKTTGFKSNNQHSYKHGHHQILEHSSSDNLNVRAAAIHIIGDIIQSVGVLIAALIIYAFPEWDVIDPMCTFMFSILVMFTTYYILKDCMIILLEGVPTEIKYDHVKMALQRIETVSSVKELHIWTLTSGKHCMAAKLVAKQNNSVVMQAHEVCKNRFKISR